MQPEGKALSVHTLQHPTLFLSRLSHAHADKTKALVPAHSVAPTPCPPDPLYTMGKIRNVQMSQQEVNQLRNQVPYRQ